MSNFNRPSNVNQNVLFSKSLFSEAEHSRMVASSVHLTTFNAGDLVPIYCREILPHQSLKLDLDFVIRQTTLLTPTMGKMHVDFYAFFVPNRVVNRSWVAVQGENLSGSWTANKVSLAPLVASSTGSHKVPIGSVADYYGFPTQLPIPNSVLCLCNDLKFRGYVMIWNEFFRDQNYQPPIPMSTLNIYEGFFDASASGQRVGLTGLTTSGVDFVPALTSPDGSYGGGSVEHAINGSGSIGYGSTIASRAEVFDALGKPLKVNKFHDYFTSVLPSPQKSNESVFAPALGSANIPPQFVTTTAASLSGNQPPLRWGSSTAGVSLPLSSKPLFGSSTDTVLDVDGHAPSSSNAIFPANLQTVGGSVQVDGLGVSIDDLRMASAIQQVYEILARGGSRYREIVQSFYGITVDDPFSDVPKCLGRISRDLDLFQTAQTSPSESGSTPQGNLAAFGYTSSGGTLFENTFLEHGYVHVFAIVRHRNVYCSYLARDNFRLNMLDFYLPPLANISEQPVYTREINPFAPNPNDPFGYNEAWAEYRFEPDIVSGYMRPMPDGEESLSLWNYSDNFDSSLQICNSVWLCSNSEEVLNRTLAVTSDNSPQFKGEFRFVINKDLPMPTYSVPGMDFI